LPSKIATRSSKQNAAIAAAVLRPIPGSCISSALVSGKRPPWSVATTCAQRCRLRARP
jgi:hypothetical protein